MDPPEETTIDCHPAADNACEISTVERSVPPGTSSSGTTCRMTGLCSFPSLIVVLVFVSVGIFIHYLLIFFLIFFGDNLITDQKVSTLQDCQTLRVGDKRTVAYHQYDGKSPGVIFLGGLMSDMSGTKALALEAHCRKVNRAFIRFDYIGHGQSSGAFSDGTIGEWLANSLAIIDNIARGQQILVGSSMGGWQMLLVARERKERVSGLVGIAAAPDFTEELMWNKFSESEKEQIRRDGIMYLPSEYGEQGLPVSLKLIEDGRDHLILDSSPLDIVCPVHLIHGMCDNEVPWQTALRIQDKLNGSNIAVTLVKNGDHRLNEEADLNRLMSVIDNMTAQGCN